MTLYISGLSIIAIGVLAVPVAAILILAVLTRKSIGVMAKLGILGFAVAAYLAIFLGDVYLNSIAMKEACKDAGSRIYKAVDADGYLETTWENGVLAIPVSERTALVYTGHKFAETVTKGGKIVRCTVDEHEKSSCQLQEVATARYEVRHAIAWYPYVGGVGRVWHTTIEDRADGEILAEYKIVDPLLGWVDRHLLQRWFGFQLRGCGWVDGGMSGFIENTLHSRQTTSAKLLRKENE